MHITVFTDELREDVSTAVPKITSWGAKYVDLRNHINGKSFHDQTPEELASLAAFLKSEGVTVACLESSLGKVHLPDDQRHEEEMKKLDDIIHAADVLGCRVVRAFFYWQPPAEERGTLATNAQRLHEVVERFLPIAQKAHDAGLTLAFENCGCHTLEIHRVVDALHTRGIDSCGQAWDVFHSFEELPRDVRAFVMANLPYTKIMHVKAQRCTQLGDETALPYTDIFRMVHAGGYRGAVSIETHSRDNLVPHDEASHRLYRAVKAAFLVAKIY